MSEFCGGAVCSNRVQVWLIDPTDDEIMDPCPRCLDTLAAMLAVTTDGPPTLVSLHAATADRLS